MLLSSFYNTWVNFFNAKKYCEPPHTHTELWGHWMKVHWKQQWLIMFGEGWKFEISGLFSWIWEFFNVISFRRLIFCYKPNLYHSAATLNCSSLWCLFLSNTSKLIIAASRRPRNVKWNGFDLSHPLKIVEDSRNCGFSSAVGIALYYYLQLMEE